MQAISALRLLSFQLAKHCAYSLPARVCKETGLLMFDGTLELNMLTLAKL